MKLKFQKQKLLISFVKVFLIHNLNSFLFFVCLWGLLAVFVVLSLFFCIFLNSFFCEVFSFLPCFPVFSFLLSFVVSSLLFSSLLVSSRLFFSHYSLSQFVSSFHFLFQDNEQVIQNSNEDESMIIFCIDVSGSMIVTSEISDAVAKKMKLKKKTNDDIVAVWKENRKIKGIEKKEKGKR